MYTWFSFSWKETNFKKNNYYYVYENFCLVLEANSYLEEVCKIALRHINLLEINKKKFNFVKLKYVSSIFALLIFLVNFCSFSYFHDFIITLFGDFWPLRLIRDWGFQPAFRYRIFCLLENQSSWWKEWKE